MLLKNKPHREQIGLELKHSKMIFQSKWFQLRQDVVIFPRQQQITYTYIEHPGSVFIVPITDEKKILLIHSYRYTIDEWCWEIPAGTLGDHVDKTPEQIAKLELEEELGAQCRTLKDIGNFYLSNGIANIKGHFFLADGVIINKKQRLESSELINQVAAVSIQEVQKMIIEGTLNDADSAFAILLALQYVMKCV